MIVIDLMVRGLRFRNICLTEKGLSNDTIDRMEVDAYVSFLC